MRMVPDTSVLVDGRITEYVETHSDDSLSVIVPEAVIGELEQQANTGQQTGWDGLEELQALTTLADNGDITLEYQGSEATPSEVAGAEDGDIDAKIRRLAGDADATLFTSDAVQAEVCRARGIAVQYLEPDVGTDETPATEGQELAFEQYFDDETMSVHLKAGTRPKAKRGALGEMRYEDIDDTVQDTETLQAWVAEIEDAARDDEDAFIELSHPGMTIVQYRDYRISMAQPPFADGIEITAVKPIVKTTLDDYDFADELRDRFTERQRGVLISGSPGAGKSTFAQAVGEFLNDSNYAVKTMEKPRDLQVGPDITQYTELAGEMENTADSLLLVRPDYTIYDEVRKTNDFSVFADMRLAGVGMVGVVHATRAIDALQRLVGRVELGMIPQVVDTVVYIEDGEVHTVYDITTQVKVPAGMQAEDLARPVIQVTNFETGEPEYEIYTFNRQVVTVPLDEVDEVAEGDSSGMSDLAEKEVKREVERLARGRVDVEFTGQNQAVVYVPEEDISHIIGSDGKRISDLEQQLGLSIDVQSHAENTASSGAAADGGVLKGDAVDPVVEASQVVIPLQGYRVGDSVEVRADTSYIFTATIGKSGEISVSRGNEIADELEQAIESGADITVVGS